ncbi:MAG: bi-domain-containing oxidoreductase [Betaproteobacteria bacterium]
MRQVTQNYKSGEIRLEEVDSPALRPGGVLVRTHFSVVSTGTEGMKVREAKLSYLGKARARPDQLKKVMQAVRQQGLLATYHKVMNKLDTLTPLGYSLAGEIVAVGPGAEEFHVGQRVACAGAGYANHAEINFVPRNLAVAVPGNVSLRHAAFATVGAIALHGYRQSGMQLGETACVVGLGLIGQLLVQILRSAGMHVIGTDLVEERCRMAESVGAKAAASAAGRGLDTLVSRLTAGMGVDCVFVAAGGASNAPTELAVRIARDRARIVDIGKTRLDLPWNEYYMKELEVRFSRSYGPGRYDPDYEERGIDYPIGYVRWSEKRNLAAFLELVSAGQVQIDPLISQVRPFAEAERVYRQLAGESSAFVSTLFEYDDTRDPIRRAPAWPNVRGAVRNTAGKVRVGMIGAGSYASTMLLPPLLKHPDVELVAVATTTGLSGQNAKRRFGFSYATTQYAEVLNDPGIDAVVIATRHASHALLVAEALSAGKTTYTEKPLGISMEDLRLIMGTIERCGNDRLMVGFNRRFSPMVNVLAKSFRNSVAPLVAHYRVHAGQLESNSWYLDRSEGTRFTGEAGHFLDVLAYIVNARPVAVVASRLQTEHATPDDFENIVAVIRYDNGSCGNLLYLTQGGSRVPKEHLEVFGGGMTAQLNNFESLLVFDHDKRHKTNMRIDKGQEGELHAFVQAVKTGGAMPIPLESLLDTTLTTLLIEEAARTGKEFAIELNGPVGNREPAAGPVAATGESPRNSAAALARGGSRIEAYRESVALTGARES